MLAKCFVHQAPSLKPSNAPATLPPGIELKLIIRGMRCCVARPNWSITMSSDSGRLEVVNVVNIEFVDNGRSLRLEIVESIPPHATRFVTLKNTCVIELFQHGGDEFPLIVVDLVWKKVLENDREPTLAALRFPFFDVNGRPVARVQTLVAIHLEGSIVGTVVAEEVLITSA
jgi:hypothetical protein